VTPEQSILPRECPERAVHCDLWISEIREQEVVQEQVRHHQLGPVQEIRQFVDIRDSRARSRPRTSEPPSARPSARNTPILKSRYMERLFFYYRSDIIQSIS